MIGGWHFLDFHGLQMVARVAELEKALAKRDFQIMHLKAALDRKDAALFAGGADAHALTNSFRGGV